MPLRKIMRGPTLLHRALVVEAILIVLDDGGHRLQRQRSICILDHVLQVEILDRDVVIAVFERAAQRFEIGLFHFGLHLVLLGGVALDGNDRAVDELRSRRGREARREVSDEFLGLFSVSPPIDELLLRHEIQAALVHLPAAQREVVELVYWGGLTRREIAEKLELPLGTVHTRLRLAMDRLRVFLGAV